MAKERAMSKVTDTVLALAKPVGGGRGLRGLGRGICQGSRGLVSAGVYRQGRRRLDRRLRGAYPARWTPCWTRRTPSRRAIFSRCPPRGRSGSSSARRTLRSSWARQVEVQHVSAGGGREVAYVGVLRGYDGRSRDDRYKRRWKRLDQKAQVAQVRLSVTI